MLSIRRLARTSPIGLRRMGMLTLIVFFVWSLAAPERLFVPRFANKAADDATYLAYAMSIALDGDLDFSNEIADALIIYPNGRIRPVHPAGPGIMAAPVVALFSVGDRLAGHPVIGDRAQLAGSWTYFGYLVASATALVGGLLLASRAASTITRSLSPAFLVLVLAGTGLPYYGLKRFTMGHSFEFFAASLVLWAVARMRRHDLDPFRPMLLVGAGVMLSLIVRPANVNIVLLPSLAYLLLELAATSAGQQSAKASSPRWLAAGTLLGLAGTFLTNAFLYGTPYPSFRQQYLSPRVAPDSAGSPPAETGEMVDASTQGLLSAAIEFVADTTPRALAALGRVGDLPNVLLTPEYGLLWFMPIVPIGGGLLLASLVTLWRRREHRRAIVLVVALATAYAAVPLGVVLVWQSHASSFGFRYVFSLIPLGLLGLALWSALPEHSGTMTRRLVIGALAMLALFSLFGQAFHETTPALSQTSTENSFGRTRSFANPSFATALLAALVQPEAWVTMVARGLPSLIALVVAPVALLIELSSGVGVVSPARRADSVAELIAEYVVGLEAAAPGTVAATLLVFGILIPFAVVYLARRTGDSRSARKSSVRYPRADSEIAE